MVVLCPWRDPLGRVVYPWQFHLKRPRHTQIEVPNRKQPNSQTRSMRRLHQTATQKIDKQNLCLFPPHQCESCRLFNRTKPNKRHLIVWRILSLENRCIRWKKPYQTIKRRAFASQKILVTPTAALFFCSVIWAKGTCLNDRWRVIYGTARRRHPLHVGV